MFYDWMMRKGLSASSALKYQNAISGALTEWATAANIISSPLNDISDKFEFDAVAEKIRQLDTYRERNRRGNSMYNAAIMQYSDFLRESQDPGIKIDVENIIFNSSLTDTEKVRLVQTRMGQGLFRQKLIDYWKGCSVTGYEDSRLLLASHIKPWRESTNGERLDVFNGLLLVPNLDAAFDQGLITFDEAGRIIISPKLAHPEKLDISPNAYVRLENAHQPYMAFHRLQFKASNGL